MSLPDTIHRLGTLCVLIGLLEPGICAGQSSDAIQAPARTLSAMVKNEAAPGIAPYYSVYVTVGSAQLAFGLPGGFQMNPYPQKIMLVNSDNTCFLSFRVISPVLPAGRSLDVDTCRKLVLGQFPGAKITSESTCHVANHAGTAFNLQWKNPGGGIQAISMAFVPAAAGVLEVGLVTVADKFDNDSYYFKLVLASIRTNEKGKVEPATPPGPS